MKIWTLGLLADAGRSRNARMRELELGGALGLADRSHLHPTGIAAQ
jgi:hypothetical protein